MGMTSIYNWCQWQWVNDRVFKDGYPVKEVARFLGFNKGAVYKHLNKKKPWSRGDPTLPPLESRKKEFMDLAKRC